MKVKGYIIVS